MWGNTFEYADAFSMQYKRGVRQFNTENRQFEHFFKFVVDRHAEQFNE